MRRTASFVVACGVALSMLSTGAAAAPSPAEAERGRVFIDFVRYDPAGTDTGSNAHLNKEIVVIKNSTSKRRTLTGWTLRDMGSNHVYRFPVTTLKPGRSIAVHTGLGVDRAGHRYWRERDYVWNNDGDKATLRTRGGSQVDACAWGDGNGSTGC